MKKEEIESFDKSMSEMYRQHDYRAMYKFYTKVLNPAIKTYASQSKPQEIPEENRQKLFNHMSTEHGLTLLESEMNSIYSICIGHEEYVKYLNWLHSKPQEIEFVKSKDQDGDDLISWKTLSGLYNVIIHNESIGVSFIPFDSNQKSQLIHHDFIKPEEITSLEDANKNLRERHSIALDTIEELKEEIAGHEKMRKRAAEVVVDFSNKLSKAKEELEQIKTDTKTVDAVEELTKLRNELFDKMPTGEVSAFALIRVIQNHLNKLDKYIESKK